MKSVGDILRDKGHDVWSTQSDATVLEALKVMADKNAGALLVLDGKRLVGIFSERDYARKIVLKGKSSPETPVAEVMTADVVSVTPGQSVADCMAIMTARRVRHLPVVEEDQLTGVISIGDVVRAVIGDHEQTIQHLETYIRGR